MEGADIYQIAKNCRTSVEMIEKYYAAHIKTSLDAAAINIMRPKTQEKQNERSRRHHEAAESDDMRPDVAAIRLALLAAMASYRWTAMRAWRNWQTQRT